MFLPCSVPRTENVTASSATQLMNCEILAMHVPHTAFSLCYRQTIEACAARFSSMHRPTGLKTIDARWIHLALDPVLQSNLGLFALHPLQVLRLWYICSTPSIHHFLSATLKLRDLLRYAQKIWTRNCCIPTISSQPMSCLLVCL